MKGFVHLYLLFAILILISGVFFYKSYFGQSVRGVATQSLENYGVVFSVSSRSALWELSAYLCETKEECLDKYNSGKRISTVSGGSVDLKDVPFLYSSDWRKYPYMKVFVSTGSGKDESVFKIASLGGVPESELHLVPFKESKYEALLIPTSYLSEGYYSSAIFTDH